MGTVWVWFAYGVVHGLVLVLFMVTWFRSRGSTAPLSAAEPLSQTRQAFTFLQLDQLKS